MKKIVTAALALSLLGSTAVTAQPGYPGRDGPPQQGYGEDRYEAYRNDPRVRMSAPRSSRGDRLPPQYRQDRRYHVDDWRQRRLRKPPRGYRWMRDDNNNYFLAAVATGMILDLLLNGR